MSDGGQQPAPMAGIERPQPPRRIGDLVRDWVGWFGPGRLAGTVLVGAVAVAAGVWLLRAPPTPVEADLPLAAAASTSVAPSDPPPPSTPATSAAGSAEVVVHVAGAVQAPGVYELPAGARGVDAIAAAGGATDTAELDGLNQAALLVDGQRLFVPTVGEVDPGAVVEPAAPGSQPPSRPVDLNEAGATELDALPGVGPATAAAIVDDRERNGPFPSVDALDRVPGIGPAKLEALRELVTV